MKKTVLITGASRGIGKATAILFAEKGYNVVVNYNNSQEAARELIIELTKQRLSAIAVRADVSKPEQVNFLVEETNKNFGKIDVLVNNAAIAQTKLFCDITESEWDNMFAVNTKSVFLVSSTVLPDMISRKSGKIINISSIWGLSGASCETHYSASKAAVIGLTKALAKEQAPSGITVNCVCPGVIDTEMLKGLSKKELDDLRDITPLNRLGTPNDVAQAVYFLASSNADFITGQVLNVDGGFLI